MDELLGPPPGSRTFDNEWQLLAARLGGDWATCKGLAPPPPGALSPPLAFNLLSTFGFPIADFHFPFAYFILVFSLCASICTEVMLDSIYSSLHIGSEYFIFIFGLIWTGLCWNMTEQPREPPFRLYYTTDPAYLVREIIYYFWCCSTTGPWGL